jgi:N-acetylglucosaminyldiphosphoundecaprenol N-acetyl-beta-D-mannosaminyltransferase
MKDQTENFFFGVRMDSVEKEAVFSLIEKKLKDHNSCLKIATINPEILLKAEKDDDYRKILNSFDLNLVDGFGIKLVGFLKNIKTGERIAGADLAGYVLNIAKKDNLKMGLVMKRGGMSTKEELVKKISSIGINKLGVIYDDERLEIIKDTEILLVGLGAPEQEKFIYSNEHIFSELKLAMGVGGTFDYWTGIKKRAPVFMRRIGLEWLWRLIIQPNRFFRIWNATAVFMWKMFKN